MKHLYAQLVILLQVSPQVRLVALVLLCLVATIVLGDSAHAQQQLLNGINETAGQAGLGAGSSGNLSLIVGEIIKGLLGFVGVLFMVLIIWGGARWMTAGGNEESVSQAKRIIRNAAVGLAIVTISYALSLWIFDVILKATDPTFGNVVEN